MYSSLMIGLALTLTAPGPKDAPKTEAKLEGIWVVEKFEGGPFPKEVEPGSVTFEFKDGAVIITEKARNKMENAKYTVDNKKSPMEIDVSPESKEDRKVLGIYKIDGNSMTLAFGPPGTDRPKDFKGDMVIVITFKKKDEKKEEKK